MSRTAEDWQTIPAAQMSTLTLVLRVWLFAHMCADAKRTKGVESESYQTVGEVLDHCFSELDCRDANDIAAAWIAGIEIGCIDSDKLRLVAARLELSDA